MGETWSAHVRIAVVVMCAGVLAGCARSSSQRAETPRADTSRGAHVDSVVPTPSLEGEPSSDSTTASAAADVVRAYYEAIAAHDYARAWHMWGPDGGASGQTLAAFEAGFAHTSSVVVDVGSPGPIDGAAGSRYCEVPVRVQAVTDHGVRQRFVGSYVIRRAVVDGATPAQRRWHIDSAHLRRQ